MAETNGNGGWKLRLDWIALGIFVVGVVFSCGCIYSHVDQQSRDIQSIREAQSQMVKKADLDLLEADLELKMEQKLTELRRHYENSR